MASTWRRSLRAWPPVQRHFVRNAWVMVGQVYSRYKKDQNRSLALNLSFSRSLLPLSHYQHLSPSRIFTSVQPEPKSFLSFRFLSFLFCLFDLLLGSCSQSHRCLWWMADPRDDRSQTANGQPYPAVDSRSIGLRRDRHGIGDMSQCGGSWIPKILLFLLTLRITRSGSFFLFVGRYLGGEILSYICDGI